MGDEPSARCVDKRGLAPYLGLSVRSLDRANALGLLPCPDLVVGSLVAGSSPALVAGSSPGRGVKPRFRFKVSGPTTTNSLRVAIRLPGGTQAPRGQGLFPV